MLQDKAAHQLTVDQVQVLRDKAAHQLTVDLVQILLDQAARQLTIDHLAAIQDLLVVAEDQVQAAQDLRAEAGAHQVVEEDN